MNHAKTYFYAEANSHANTSHAKAKIYAKEQGNMDVTAHYTQHMLTHAKPTHHLYSFIMHTQNRERKSKNFGQLSCKLTAITITFHAWSKQTFMHDSFLPNSSKLIMHIWQ